MRRIIRQVNKMNRISKLILHTGLPIIATIFLVIFIYIKSAIWDPWYIHRLLPSMLEYLMMSLTLVIGGALLIDYATKGSDEEKK